MSNSSPAITAIIPAAGVGKRMQADRPKQYLTINDKTILVHTVERMLSVKVIHKIVIVIDQDDDFFTQTKLTEHDKVITVFGGAERVDSVLAGLQAIKQTDADWVMVHDAARPCVTRSDIEKLITHCLNTQQGGLLAAPVNDTMKLAGADLSVDKTIDRRLLWRAYTPQMYPVAQLIQAIENGIDKNIAITDESSAIEAAGFVSHLIEGRSDNIKITRPDDLAIASFILQQQQEILCE